MVVGKMDRGGTESMLMNHYRHVDRTKLQFDFVVHSDAPNDFDEEIKALGGKVFCVPRFNVLNYFQYCSAWHHFFVAHPEYKVVHVHHFLVAGIVLPIAENHGIKIRIAHSHNTKPPIFILKEKVMWVFHRSMIKASTLRLACSDAAGKYLFGNETYEVFNNAIEVRRYNYNEAERNRIRKEFGLENTSFVIGHIGSFRTRQKNHSFLMDIFDEVQKVRPEARLLLVGDGDLRQEIQDKAKRLGISNKCIFAGVRPDVPSLLSAMDVFVFPSFFEGLSVVSVEVQASGLPCIASENVTKESILTDIFWQKSLESSAKEWAESIVSVKMHRSRETYSEDVSNAGYDVINNVKKLEKYYNVYE